MKIPEKFKTLVICDRSILCPDHRDSPGAPDCQSGLVPGQIYKFCFFFLWNVFIRNIMFSHLFFLCLIDYKVEEKVVFFFYISCKYRYEAYVDDELHAC